MNIFKIEAIGPKDSMVTEVFHAESELKAIDEFNSRYFGFVIIKVTVRSSN